MAYQLEVPICPPSWVKFGNEFVVLISIILIYRPRRRDAQTKV